jgi:hypothetical protein
MLTSAAVLEMYLCSAGTRFLVPVASFEFCLGTLQVALLETCKSAQEHQRLLPVAQCS